MAYYQKSDYFPIIAQIIDIKLSQQISTHRNEIAKILLESNQIALERIAKDSNKSVLFISHNMVDWFSAELTKQSDIVAEWQNKYSRTKIKVNGRKVTNYSLALNTLQDEKLEENTVSYKEGSIKQITVNAYERNPKARQVCLSHHGYTCQCCNFNFGWCFKKYAGIKRIHY